jgi:hypothetical protein
MAQAITANSYTVAVSDAMTTSAQPGGVGAVSQPLILTGKQSGFADAHRDDAAKLFGWDTEKKPGVQLNQQFVISTEQLQEIRALREQADAQE